jgi:hypothetical protein
MSPARLTVTALLLAGLTAATSISLSHARATAPSSLEAVLEVPAVPPSVARILSLGFKSLLADAYYLQAIQVFGDRSLLRMNPQEKARHCLIVYRLLDYATELDPRFDYAYVFGANAVPVSTFEGGVLNIKEDVALLKKGTANGGHDWRIPFQLAYMLSSYVGDIAGAASAMAEAARRPDGPPYLPFLATRLAAAGGDIETAIQLVEAQIARVKVEEEQTPEDQRESIEQQRKAYEERLRLLRMTRDLRTLEAAIGQYQRTHRQLPERLEALVEVGLLPGGIPTEPHGGKYLYDPATGKVGSSKAQRLDLTQRVREEIDQNVQKQRATAPVKP